MNKTVSVKPNKSRWIIIPLALIVIICLCLIFFQSSIVTNLTESPVYTETIWSALLPICLIALFSVMYGYKVVAKKPIAPVSTAMLYVLFVAATVFIIGVGFIVTQKEQWCTDVAGAITDCAQSYGELLYLFFANPYSLILLNGITLLGYMGLLIKPKITHYQ